MKYGWINRIEEPAGVPTELKDYTGLCPNRASTNITNDIGWSPNRVERLNQLASQQRINKHREWNMGGAIPAHCKMKHGLSNSSPWLNETWAEQFQPMAKWNMGESIGLRKLVNEGRVELAIQDLRGLMRGLLERILFSRPKHENTGLESLSIIQILTQITNNCTVK